MEDMLKLEEEAEEERREADVEVDPSQAEDNQAAAELQLPQSSAADPELQEMDLEPCPAEDIQAPQELPQLTPEQMAALERFRQQALQQAQDQDIFGADELDSDEEDESYQPHEEEDDEDGDGPSLFYRRQRRIQRHNQRRLKQEGWRLVYGLLNFSPEDPACAGHLARIQELMIRRPEAFQFLDELRRTVLHLALLRWRTDLLKLLLTFEEGPRFSELALRPFQAGDDASKGEIPCLHLAMSGIHLEHAASASLRCLQMLLDLDLPLTQQVDTAGRNALHVACAAGSAAAVQMLLDKGAEAGLKDDFGLFPLHYAIDSRNIPCVQTILQASDQALFPGELHPFYRCIERQVWEVALLLHKQNWIMGDEAELDRIFCFAKERGLDKEWEFVCEKGLETTSSLKEVVWNPEVFKEPCTVLVTHPLCVNHRAIPKEADDPEVRLALIGRIPENPHRLEVLAGPNGVLRADQFRELRWIPEASPAALVDVLRVHEFWYVKKLLDTVREARGMDLRHLAVDAGDTKVSEESWSAATRAAGAVLEAVDQVCNETARNAFCCVRPPGHHLGPAGAVDKEDLMDDPEGSQGFCLLNNVAIGAAYARCVYRHLIHKVAIIDFDVHHGNGTEAIVKNMRHREDVPPERIVTYFHAGHTMRMKHIPAATCKPWLDPESDVESVFFASIHGFAPGFYPGTGKTAESSQPRILNVGLRRKAGPVEFRRGLRQRILPALQEFGPDLVFISAGFDGHEDDLLGCCCLSEEDYVWATQQLMAVANRCCQGRVISVLEGGYNTRAEALSPFASAVSAHVRTLMYTSPNFKFLDYEVELASGEQESQAEIAEKMRFQKREEARRLRRKRGWDFAEGCRQAKKVKGEEEEKTELCEEEKADQKAFAEAEPGAAAAASPPEPSPLEVPDMFAEEQESAAVPEAPAPADADDAAAAAEAPGDDAPDAEVTAAEAAAEELVDMEVEPEAQDTGVNSSAEDLPPAEDQQPVETVDAAALPPVEEQAKEQTAGEGDEEEAQLEDAERLLRETAGLLQKVGAEDDDLPDADEEEAIFEDAEERDFLADAVQ